MVNIVPVVYIKYMNYDAKGNRVLYVIFFKHLYLTMKEYLLFYNKLVKDLKAISF